MIARFVVRVAVVAFALSFAVHTLIVLAVNP